MYSGAGCISASIPGCLFCFLGFASLLEIAMANIIDAIIYLLFNPGEVAHDWHGTLQRSYGMLRRIACNVRARVCCIRRHTAGKLLHKSGGTAWQYLSLVSITLRRGCTHQRSPCRAQYSVTYFLYRLP